MTISKLCTSFLLLCAINLVQAEGQENPSIELENVPCPKDSAISVYVSEQNTILLNGKLVSIESLGKDLGAVVPTIKLVCYSRANPEAYEPPPISTQVMEKIMATNLPVSFYWDSEFKKRVIFK